MPVRCAAAEAAADVAGAVIRPFFRAGFATDTQGRPTPGDHRRPHRRAGDARRAGRARFPTHGILGEEFGLDRPEARAALGARPDRRHPRLHHRPADLRHADRAAATASRPILGVIDQPVTGERWIGAAGRPTALPRPVRRRGRLPALRRASPRPSCPAPAREMLGADAAALASGCRPRCARNSWAATATPTACWRSARST